MVGSENCQMKKLSTSWRLRADKKKSAFATFDPNEVREFKFGSEDLRFLVIIMHYD